MSDQSRHIVVTLDLINGTHTLHNWPTLPYSKCIEICQSMRQTEENKHRMILKAHNDSGD